MANYVRAAPCVAGDIVIEPPKQRESELLDTVFQFDYEAIDYIPISFA
jgi:hypothetical protein